jgi:hypothetical protein
MEKTLKKSKINSTIWFHFNGSFDTNTANTIKTIIVMAS